MFELYTRNIDPEDEVFHTFIKNYVASTKSRDPETLAYSDLYKIIKEGIREYLKQKQGKSKK
jgi:hypothetical protein